MENFEVPSGKRQFFCGHCKGRVLIPYDLPPTTGPCPHCGGTITSPALEPTTPLPAATPPASTPPAAAPKSSAQPLPAVPISSPLPIQGQPAATPPAARTAPAMPDSREAAAAPPAAKPAGTPTAPVSPVPAPTAPPRPDPPASESADRSAPARPAVPEPKSGPAKSADPPLPPKEPARESPASKRGLGVLVPLIIVLVLLIGGVIVAVYVVVQKAASTATPAPPPPDPAAATTPSATGDSTVREENYLRVGWRKDAYRVLDEFMAATTAEGKLPHILRAEPLAERIADFYGGGVIDDSDTPAEAFSVYELSIEDRRRGLFMMIYDQPPQFDMKEFFRPLAPLEVQHNLKEADLLLSTFARASNFAMEPLRVHAFFKRGPEGIKLDWEVFAQTKYRTLRSFVELPETGLRGVFRVFVVEDVPQRSRMEAGTRTYRVADPATPADSARINVRVDSETGRALAPINWRGIPDARPVTRTATVELRWGGDAADPQLEISRFICWEFLGLGGEETTANEVAEQ